jgi:hypothetical protein
MRHSRLRLITTVGALALITTLPLSACGGPSVSPRPVQAAENEPAVAAGPSTAASSGAPSTAASSRPGGTRQEPARPKAGEPVRTTTTRPPPKPVEPTSTEPTGSCFGAVRHTIDLQNTELALVKSLCFHTGGVLRLHSIGPGLVTATPRSLVSQTYEAAVVDVRFVRPGTVTVTIPQDEQTYTIEVVVRS